MEEYRSRPKRQIDTPVGSLGVATGRDFGYRHHGGIHRRIADIPRSRLCLRASAGGCSCQRVFNSARGTSVLVRSRSLIFITL